jgi:hypothetical protein
MAYVTGSHFAKKNTMKITLQEPELELIVNKVDTPTGTGWCVIMPDERKIVIKDHNGQWETNEVLNDQFVQVIGNEINRVLEAKQPENVINTYSLANPRPKRTRILKYFLI